MDLSRKYLPDIKFDTKLTTWKLRTPLYKNSKTGPRVLIVLDHVTSNDRTAGMLLAGNNRIVLENILKYLTKQRKVQWSQCLVVAFPFSKVKEQSGRQVAQIQSEAKRRLNKYIKKYSPDRILFMGPDLTRQLLPSRLSQVDATRLSGVVREYQGIPATSTLSLSTVATDFSTDKQDLDRWPNLIGFVVNHLNYLLLEPEQRFTVNVADYQCKVLDTYTKFKKFYKKLVKAKRVAIDVEGDNLSKFSNELFSIQFAFDGKTAYVLPWKHPETPFKAKDLEKISKKLVHYFEYGTSDYHILTYAQFDLTQLKIQLQLRYYGHRIWDITAGAYALDENRKFLWDLVVKNDDEKRFPAYSLAQLALERGCTIFYEDLPISKADRSRLRELPLKDIAVYGGYDVVVPYQIHQMQQAEANYRGPQYNRFTQIVVDQIGSMIHEFVEMEVNGLYCDINYLLSQFKSDSAIETYIRKLEHRFYKFPSVKKANKLLRKQKRIPDGGLFTAEENHFDISKVESQQLLFFRVLKLKILANRADNKGGKIDKPFQYRYKNVKEVRYFTKWNKAKSLRNTFIKGFYRILQSDVDSKFDRSLHPKFNFISIITGRSGAEKPSLQQVPNHGELAGIIKRIFIPPKGHILIKVDYMAHEIRNWALVAGDEVLEAAFKVGFDARRAYQLLKVIDAGVKQEWAQRFKEADIHRVNYGFFYSIKPGKVTSEQRQSIKEIVFGVLYGKSANGLARVLGVTRQQAQELIDLLFTRFAVGGKWVKDTIQFGRDNAYVIGPHGRVRHLWGYLHWENSVHSNMDRRGPNSAIQGVSSDEGYIGGRELQHLVWNYFEKHGQPFSLRSRNKVHDSSENTVAIQESPIALYLIQSAYIRKVREKYAKEFDFKMNFDLELDMGLGGSLNNITDWDFTTPHLLEITATNIDWMRDNLGYKLNKNKLMRRTQHNADIIHRVRRQELKNNDGVMLLTEKNVHKVGFKLASPAVK